MVKLIELVTIGAICVLMISLMGCIHIGDNTSRKGVIIETHVETATDTATQEVDE